MIDAHSYLMSIQECQQRIDLKVQQVQDLRAQIESISAPLDKEQVSHTRNVAVMADTIATIVDMQKEIDQQTNDLMIAKRKALRLLDLLKPESEVILIKRYFENKNVIELGKILFVTRRQAQRKLTEAIAAFQNILDQQSEENL